MKKIVISFIAGALLMASGQAMADSISRIGKKVGGEAAVYLNGEQLSDAIIVENKSYAPVRDIAEAFGADVGFEAATKGEKAVIDLKTGDEVVSEEVMETPNGEVRITDIPINELNLTQVEMALSMSRLLVWGHKVKINKENVTEEEKAELENLLVAEEQRLAELEARKAELEAQQ